MICPRCGAEMKPEQRYCMKCGALNYNHPDNQKMKQYITNEEFEKANEEYQEAAKGPTNTIVIGGKVYADEPAKDKKSSYVDTRSALGLLTIVAIVMAVLCYFIFHFSILLSLVFALCYFIITFYLIVNSCIYMKGGYSGFTPIIPFYSQYAYYDIAFGNGWLFLISLIPIVNIFYGFYANYKIGKVYGKSGWLTLFFPFILLPIIAFSDKVTYDGKGKKYKEYVDRGKRRNTVLPAFLYSGIMFFAFLLIATLPIMNVVKEKFYENDVKNIYQTIRKDVEDGYYQCEDGNINSDDGTYYIVIEDATELNTLPIPVRSSLNGEPISGYIRIDTVNGKPKYTYVMTDGENVVSNASIYEVSVPDDAIICEKS